jgi:hypothetical protein
VHGSATKPKLATINHMHNTGIEIFWSKKFYETPVCFIHVLSQVNLNHKSVSYKTTLLMCTQPLPLHNNLNK